MELFDTDFVWFGRVLAVSGMNWTIAIVQLIPNHKTITFLPL